MPPEANDAWHLAVTIWSMKSINPHRRSGGGTGSERREQSDVDTGDTIPDGITPQNFNYRAEIITSQTTPPAGTYTDSIIVDVQF